MKKLTTFFIVVLIGLASLSVNSCKKTADALTPNPANCDALLNAYSAAVNAYILDQSVANCEAYVDALDNYINGCAILTPAQKQAYNDELDNIDCSN
jgi:hypothetical protein